LAFAARGLWRSRAFTLAAVLTLASGASATILAATLVWSVLLKPLPVHDQPQLIVAWCDLPASGFAHDAFGDRAITRRGRRRALRRRELWRTTHSAPTDGRFGEAARRKIDLRHRSSCTAGLAAVRTPCTREA
jgi:hypothetical protein